MDLHTKIDDIIIENEFNTDSSLHANIVDVLNEVKTDNVIDINRTDLDLNAMFLEFCDKESTTESDSKNLQSLPGISYIIIFTGGTKKNYVTFDCVLCNPHYGRILSGRVMTKHLRSRSHLLNTLKLHTYSLYEKYKDSATETHSELADEVYNCELNTEKHITIVTAKNYSEERRKLSSVVTQLYEKCKKIHVKTTPIFDYSQSSNDAKTSVTSEDSFSPCINYSLSANHLTVAEKLAMKAKNRHPKQVVFVLDREDLPLEIKKFEDVIKVVRIPNLNFSNAIENLQKYKIIGNGSHIIILCGIYSLISASVAEICKEQNCLNPINKYTVDPSISCDGLVSKALTVHEYVLNNTSHDQVTFCDIVPINISNRVVKTCASRHSIQYDTLQEIYIKYLNIIDEYNSFIDIHCQILGIKNLNLLDILFPVESNNIIRPLDYLYNSDQVDKEKAAKSFNEYISELLKGMGIEIQDTTEAVPKSQPKDMKLKGLQNILKNASKKLANSKSKSLLINSTSLPAASPSNVELGGFPEIETTLFSPPFANSADSIKPKTSHPLYTTNTISATSDSSAALEAFSSVMPQSAVSEEEELLSQSKGNLFDHIIIVTNPEYLSYMKKLIRPGVTVACAASGGLDQISYTIKCQGYYKSGRLRILWLTHTEVFKVFRNEMSTMCTSCFKPLEVKVPIMLTSSPSNFVAEIQNSFDELTKKINSFLDRSNSFAVLPPLPPSFLVLEKAKHDLCHKIFSEKKVQCHMTTSEALGEFERMLSELRKQMIPFTLSQLTKLNIEHCMADYAGMVNTWNSYLDIVTCDNILNSDKFVGEKYSKWFQYVNKFLSECLKSESFENISGKALSHEEIRSSETQDEEKNFISKISNVTSSNQENNANLVSVVPDSVIFADHHSSCDKGHYEHFVFICFSLEHADLIAQEKLNAKNIYTVIILDNSICWIKAKEEIEAVVTSDMENILFIIMGTMSFLGGSFREFCSNHKIIPSGEGLSLIKTREIAYMTMSKVYIFISRLRSYFRSRLVLTPLFFTKRFARPFQTCSYMQNVRIPLCTHLRDFWNQKMLQLLYEELGEKLKEMKIEDDIEYSSTYNVYWDEHTDTFVTLYSNYDQYCRNILRRFIAAFSDDTCESSAISIQSNLNEQTSQEIAHDTKLVSQEIKNESQNEDDYDSQSRDSKLTVAGNNTPQGGDYHTNSNMSTVASAKFPDASHSVSDYFYGNNWKDLVTFGLQTLLQYLVEAINGLKSLSHQKAKVLCIGSCSNIVNEIKDRVSKTLSSFGESGAKLVVLENMSNFSDQFDCLLTTPADLMAVTGSWDLLGINDVRAVIVYDVMKLLKKSMSKRSLITIIDRMELKKNTAINKVFASESYQSGLKYCLTSLFQIPLEEIKDSPWPLKNEIVDLETPQMKLETCEKNDAFCQIKILLERHVISNVIGRRGENIETLKRNTNSQFDIPKKSEYFPGTSQGLCWISGSVEAVLKSLFYIIELKKSMSPPGSELKMEFAVPDSTAKLLIGENKKNLQQIMIKSKTYIQMYQKKDYPSPNESFFAVNSYDMKLIKTAFSLILECIVPDSTAGRCSNMTNPNASLPPSSFYEALNNNADSPWLLKNEIVNLETPQMTQETWEKNNCCQMKILLENKLAGKVIGARGSTRQKLMVDTNSQIIISQKSEYFPGTSLRTCSISGTADAVLEALCIIIGYKRLLFPRDEIKMEFAVPDSAATLIIGEKEENIQRIMIQSKAYIQMYQKNDYSSPDESCFAVNSYDVEFMKTAFSMILECIVFDPENSTRRNRTNLHVSLPSNVYQALNTNTDQSDKTTSDVSLHQELREQNNKDVRCTELDRQVSGSYSSSASNPVSSWCPGSSNQTPRQQSTVNASVDRRYFTEDRYTAVGGSHDSGYQTFSNQLVSQYQGASHYPSTVYPSTSNQSCSGYRTDEYSSASSHLVSGYSGNSYEKDVGNPFLSSQSSSEYSVMDSGNSTFSKETSMYQSIYRSNSPGSFACHSTTPNYQKSPTRESHSRSGISSTRRERSRSHSPRKRSHSRSRDRKYYRSHDRDHSPFLRDKRRHSRSKSGDYSEYENKRTRTKYSDSNSRSPSNSRDENQFGFRGERSDRFHVSRSQSRSNPQSPSPYSKSINANFSVLGALNLLDRACDKIGELGRMAKSVITSIRSELGVDRKKVLRLIKEKSNVALFRMVIDNLDSILPSSSLTEVSFISQAIDWTTQLIEYSKEEEGIIDFEALAVASMNKTTEVTLQLIKSAFAYEGKLNPTDEEINEAVLKVSYLQCKMALKED